MNDLLSESRITLTDLAKREGVNCCTVWRWANRGVKSIRLETYSRGGRRFTTLPAFERWIAKINGENRPAGRTPRQREADQRRAERELDTLGV